MNAAVICATMSPIVDYNIFKMFCYIEPMKKTNKITVNLTNAKSFDEYYLESAINKINKGALTLDEADAIVSAASIEGAKKILNKMFDTNNAVVIEFKDTGELEIVQLYCTRVDESDACETESTTKKQNIFKRLWKKVFKK